MANVSKYFQEWWNSKFHILLTQVPNVSIKTLMYTIFADGYYEGYEHGYLDGNKFLHKKTADELSKLSGK